jgi:O-antigen/teichoic acid export membrane protein
LEWRRIASFAVSTNLIQTVNMVSRDSEVLWVGFFLNSTAAGYYKFALAIMNIILMPITPFIQTTFPEMARAVTGKAWTQIRTLLRRTSLIAVAWTGIVIIALLAAGRWLLGIFKNGDFLPALPIIWVLLIGFSFANILYWNRSLLLAFARPNFPLAATAIAGLVKIALMFLLVPRFGAVMQAAALSLFFILSIGAITIEGLRGLKTAETTQSALETAV